MPFDTTLIDHHTATIDATISTVPCLSEQPMSANSLATLGIHPVPRDLAETHKIEMIQTFSSRNPYYASLVADGTAHWSRRWINRFDSPHGFVFHTPDFRFIRRVLMKAAGNSTPDKTAAPEAIIHVAEVVHRSINKVAFEIEYFYDDPILNAHYRDDDGVVHNDCLGIWNNGVVVAIASLPPEPVRVRRWFGWLFNR